MLIIIRKILRQIHNVLNIDTFLNKRQFKKNYIPAPKLPATSLGKQEESVGQIVQFNITVIS